MCGLPHCHLCSLLLLFPLKWPKKSNIGLIIGIVVLAAILFMGAIGAMGWFVFHNIINKTEEVIVEDDDFEEEESEIETEEESEEPVVEIVADKQELFNNYIQEELQYEYSVIDLSKTYEANYVINQEYSFPEQYFESMSGILTTKIADFDVDGEEELLAVMLIDNEIYYRMYEEEDNTVTMHRIIAKHLLFKNLLVCFDCLIQVVLDNKVSLAVAACNNLFPIK